jgi:hypothetical protein
VIVVCFVLLCGDWSLLFSFRQGLAPTVSTSIYSRGVHGPNPSTPASSSSGAAAAASPSSASALFMGGGLPSQQQQGGGAGLAASSASASAIGIDESPVAAIGDVAAGRVPGGSWRQRQQQQQQEEEDEDEDDDPFSGTPSPRLAAMMIDSGSS